MTDPIDPAVVAERLLSEPSVLVAHVGGAVSALETTSAEVAKLASAGVETTALEGSLSALGTQLTAAGADARTLADDYVGGLLYDPSTLVAHVAGAASALEAVQAEVTLLSATGVATTALSSALSIVRAQLAAVSAYAGELETAYN